MRYIGNIDNVLPSQYFQDSGFIDSLTKRLMDMNK